MNIKTPLIFLTLLLIHSFAQAKTSTDYLKDMTSTYSQVEYMKTDYTKKEKSALLGEESSSQGELEYSKGKIRVAEKAKGKEDKNLFIKNKTTYWHIQGDEVSSGATKNAMPTVFELMFEDPKVWEDLQSKITGADGSVLKIEIQVKGKMSNIDVLTVFINTQKRRFEKIHFTDDIGNKTKVDFKNTLFYRKAPEGRFVYKK